MYLIEKTVYFDKWLRKLKDNFAKSKILTRLKRLERGHFGDAKALKNKLHELKIDYGPGYRIYYTKKGDSIILLICGGDKSTQINDIDKAKEILKELEQENDS